MDAIDQANRSFGDPKGQLLVRAVGARSRHVAADAALLPLPSPRRVGSDDGLEALENRKTLALGLADLSATFQAPYEPNPEQVHGVGLGGEAWREAFEAVQGEAVGREEAAGDVVGGRGGEGGGEGRGEVLEEGGEEGEELLGEGAEEAGVGANFAAAGARGGEEGLEGVEEGGDLGVEAGEVTGGESGEEGGSGGGGHRLRWRRRRGVGKREDEGNVGAARREILDLGTNLNVVSYGVVTLDKRAKNTLHLSLGKLIKNTILISLNN